jgi:hypothetical protein
VTKDRPIPSSEAMLDVKAVVERTMLSPKEDLLGVLVLAVARDPRGRRIARLVAVPLDGEEMLLKAMRNYLARPGRPAIVQARVNGPVTRSVTRRAAPSGPNRL